MRSDTYKTKQKQLILDCVKTNSHTSMTAKDIELSLTQNGVIVGKSTIYRYLEKLVDAGEIRKFVDEESKSASFQFIGHHHDCQSHLHLKCINCGSFLHLDCNYMKDVTAHIHDQHKFSIDNSKTIILGICENCNKK